STNWQRSLRRSASRARGSRWTDRKYRTRTASRIDSMSLMAMPRRPIWILAFAVALLAILAVGFVSYTEMTVLANSSARVQHTYDVLQTLHDLNTALSDTETNQRGYLISQDTAYLERYDAAIAQIRLALAELRR